MPKNTYCLVRDCVSRRGVGGAKFVSLPNPDLQAQREAWRKLIRVDKLPKWGGICTNHFTKEDFVLCTGEKAGTFLRLRAGVLPSQRLPPLTRPIKYYGLHIIDEKAPPPPPPPTFTPEDLAEAAEAASIAAALDRPSISTSATIAAALNGSFATGIKTTTTETVVTPHETATTVYLGEEESTTETTTSADTEAKSKEVGETEETVVTTTDGAASAALTSVVDIKKEAVEDAVAVAEPPPPPENMDQDEEAVDDPQPKSLPTQPVPLSMLKTEVLKQVISNPCQKQYPFRRPQHLVLIDELEKKVARLQHENARLVKRNEKLSSEYQSYRRRTYTLEKKVASARAKTVTKAELKDKIADKLERWFTPAQVRILQGDSWARFRLKHEDYTRCEALRLVVGDRGYRFMRRNGYLPLPSLITLKNVAKTYPVPEGIHAQVIQLLRENADVGEHANLDGFAVAAAAASENDKVGGGPEEHQVMLQRQFQAQKMQLQQQQLQQSQQQLVQPQHHIILDPSKPYIIQHIEQDEEEVVQEEEVAEVAVEN